MNGQRHKHKCKFCEVLNGFLEYNKESDNNHEYGVKLYEETEVKGKLKGGTTWGKYELNFCPECGKKIIRSEE